MLEMSVASPVEAKLFRQNKYRWLSWLTADDPGQTSESRTVPAKVYPAIVSLQGWIVEPPVTDAAESAHVRIFIGSEALTQALEHALRIYGGVIYLSR
jgi:hypothetical protein